MEQWSAAGARYPRDSLYVCARHNNLVIFLMRRVFFCFFFLCSCARPCVFAVCGLARAVEVECSAEMSWRFIHGITETHTATTTTEVWFAEIYVWLESCSVHK